MNSQELKRYKILSKHIITCHKANVSQEEHLTDMIGWWLDKGWTVLVKQSRLIAKNWWSVNDQWEFFIQLMNCIEVAFGFPSMVASRKMLHLKCHVATDKQCKRHYLFLKHEREVWKAWRNGNGECEPRKARALERLEPEPRRRREGGARTGIISN